MGEKELAEQLMYSSPFEIYVVTWRNKLLLVRCPFKVVVLVNIGTLKQNQVVMVSKVKVTKEMKTVFIIKNAAYYYFYFDFVI